MRLAATARLCLDSQAQHSPRLSHTRRAALRSMGDVGEGLPLRNRAWKQGEEKEYKGGKREERGGRGGGGSSLQCRTWIDSNGH